MERHKFSLPLFLAPLIILGAWLLPVGFFYLLGVPSVVPFVIGGVYLYGIAVVFVIVRRAKRHARHPLIWRRRNDVF